MRLQGNYNQRNNIGVCHSFFCSLIYATTSTDFYRMFVERTITMSPFCEFIHGKRLCSFLYIFSNDTYKTSIFKNNLVEIRLPTITGDIEQNKVSSKVKPSLRDFCKSPFDFYKPIACVGHYDYLFILK